MTTKSSIIEQAAKRLEELKRSGVAAPPPLDRRQPSGAIALGRVTAGGRPEATDAQRTHFPTATRGSGEVEIDLTRLGKMGYLTPGDTQTMVASEFRHIKRPLLRNVAAEGGAIARSSLIMITSAVAGEGKTFCAINLAMSIAMEVDTSVLLVDADVVRPALLERLGLAPKPGLLDVLTGEAANLTDVILRTNVPKLSILPAGAPRAMATELLASAAMGALLLDLATRYSDRVVVLDAPPLLVTTESPVLASMVGQVVIVVDSERTPVPKVTQAFARVEACPVVLSLLNKCSEPAVSDGYGYGYT